MNKPSAHSYKLPFYYVAIIKNYFGLYASTVLLWINALLDFICMGFAEQWGTGGERKIQMKIACANIKHI